VAADRADGISRVDVGIPAYRRADFIVEAVESVLAQTLDDWRLTICDNGAGGGAIEEAVQPYLADPRVSYRASGRELTLGENWTAAIQGGSAYVGLLNDDDRWHPGFLEARVAALDAHPECGFAFTEVTHVDQTGAVVEHSPVRFEEGVVSRETMARWFIGRNIVGVSSILVRRSAYDVVGAVFESGWHYNDWEMWSRLAARFPAYYLHRHDNDYRRHSQAITFVKREDPERLLEMMDLIQRRFERELPCFRVGRLERRRNRSLKLLHSSGDVHRGGGWRRSWPLYRRALREYPLSVVQYTSLQMIGRTLVGRRRARAIARAVRRIGKRVEGRRSHATSAR
jgi:glycosyltransferase involved in cell wall biosynthesis